MNKFLMILSFCCFLFSCDIRKNKTKEEELAAEAQVFKDSTTVQMIDSVYNFGKVVEGEKAEFSFRFKNTGKNPLIISKTDASCGCTVPERPEEPIRPGETGFIKVVYNSSGPAGSVQKEIRVISNAYPGFPVLQLKGEVTPKK